jgi:hypothetical protein
MNKKGQFFLIAALIIAGVILSIGIIQISTKASQSETTKVYDLSKEMNYESNQVIDYGVYKALPNDQKITNIEALVTYYSSANPSDTMVIFYGNAKEYRSWAYSPEIVASSGVGGTGKINLIESKLIDLTGSTTISGIGADQKITVIFNGKTIEFDLKAGENFYILLQEKRGEEQIVASD